MNKYKNKKTTYKGMLFDSMVEADRYIELEQLQKKGKIQNLDRQVVYTILPQQIHNGVKVQPVKYKADFIYTIDGTAYMEDVKGYQTQEYRLKRKLIIQYCNYHKIIFIENKPIKKPKKVINL